MRTKIIIIFCLIAAIFSNSYAQTASLTVFSQDGERFWLIMNGIRQNQTPETNVLITGLTDNNYRIKVIFEDESIPSIDRNISPMGVDGMMNQTQVIRRDRRGRHVMRLSSFEPVSETHTVQAVESQQFSAPYTSVERTAQEEAEATTHRESLTTEIIQTDVYADEDEDVFRTGVRVRDPETGEVIGMDFDVSEAGLGLMVDTPEESVGVSMDIDARQKGRGRHTTTTTTTTTTSITTTTHGRPPHYYEELPPVEEPAPPAYVLPGYNGPIGCDYPMSPEDFNRAKSSISSRSFEDSKLTMAKQVASANCLLSSQVKEIMQLFSFEDSRLEFAKYAYPYTFDIGNYYMVNEAFTFEMSIDELNRFLSRQ